MFQLELWYILYERLTEGGERPDRGIQTHIWHIKLSVSVREEFEDIRMLMSSS